MSKATAGPERSTNRHTPEPARFGRICGLLSCIAVSAVGVACSPYPPPPDTRVEEVTDTLHGIAFTDPYRWLEDRDAPETRAWLDVQNAYAETIVGDSPLRQHVKQRLRALTDVADPPSARRAGDFEYFSLRRVGQELPVIYRRPAPEESSDEPIDPTGEYEVVLDPHNASPDHTTRYSIVTFSPDDNLMIYNQRDGGMDELRIRVRNLADAVDLPDSLPLSLYGSTFFARDGEGFYYVKRSREIGPRVLYHELGTDIANDRVIFGDGYGPESFISVSQAAEGRYFLYSVQHGWAKTELHLQDWRRGGALTPVVADLDARFYSRVVDGTLYMRTDFEANNNRLLAVDLSNPGQDNWREVIPESEDLMEDFTLIDDKFYVTYLHNVSNRIRIFEKDGTPAGEVDVPELHSASISSGSDGKATLSLRSFTVPGIEYELDLATGERTVKYEQQRDWNSDGVVARQVWRTSADGTRAPMFLLHREDIELNGQNPTLLSGYGGFYVARKPGFSTTGALWVELGGVYAVATLRGGSEFGESWHRDGMLTNKQNVFDDFISAAEWLVDSGYTRPEKLAIQGSSNGGLLVGAAFTQRPELFRAVGIGFPDVDILRFFDHMTNNNAPALLEYGDARIPEEFEAIRQYSPYQNVRARTAYPAIMFSTGDLDTRVPPLGARKMTARLQAATTSGLPVILRYHAKAGHAGSRGVPFSQRLEDITMELTFLLQQLGVEGDLETRTGT